MLADDEINAIIISNFYCSHARMAIQALKSGKHVLSEITAAVTPKECVDLVEAVEESGKVYSLLENYACIPTVLQMKQRVDNGEFGQIVYAEGEYCHPMLAAKAKRLQMTAEEHWRAYRPCTFYADHALAPLMHVLNITPTSVVAKPAQGPKDFADEHGYHYTEMAGVMLVSTKEGPLLRISGCTHYAGHGRYYRAVGDLGGIETVRGHAYSLRYWYNTWSKPEGLDISNLINDVEYSEELRKKYDFNGLQHQGSDVLLLDNFFKAIRGEEKPIFDVYKAVNMSAVQIYGWRSILGGSNNIELPDFTNKTERDKIRDDDLTPFYVDDKEPTLPCTVGI